MKTNFEHICHCKNMCLIFISSLCTLLLPWKVCVSQDYHFHLIGGVGLMFLDIRGSRTFHRVDGDKKIYLGDGQWSAIKKTLSAEGIFAEARALLVCSPAPLVFLEPRITQSAAAAFHRLEDFKGHWSFGEHIKEQIMMIDSLCEWKNAASREVLVLGGKGL